MVRSSADSSIQAISETDKWEALFKMALFASVELVLVGFFDKWILPKLRYSSIFLPFFEQNDAIARTATIISSGAALLLSGVIIMAPLLSLSLHQSYDFLFDFRRHLHDKHQKSEGDYQGLLRNVEKRWREQLTFYTLFNPLYLGTWISALVILIGAVINTILDGWSSRELFYDSLAFMMIACVLSISFSVIAIAFFVTTRPGITKLQLFVQYLDQEKPMDTPRGEPQPKAPDAAAPSVSITPIQNIAN